MDSAKQFVYENNLDVDHIQTIVEFIKNNTSGQQFQIHSEPMDTSEDGNQNVQSQLSSQSQPQKPKGPPGLFPLLKPLNFNSLTALKQIKNKIFSANEDLELQNSDKCLSNQELTYCTELFNILMDSHMFHVSKIEREHVSIFKQMFLWPDEYLFACK